MKQVVEVTILGQPYTVRSAASPDEVRRVARFVNGKIDEAVAASRSADTLGNAILALMNVSGLFLRQQGQAIQENGAEVAEVCGRLRNLLARIDEVGFAEERARVDA